MLRRLSGLRSLYEDLENANIDEFNFSRREDGTILNVKDVETIWQFLRIENRRWKFVEQFGEKLFFFGARFKILNSFSKKIYEALRINRDSRSTLYPGGLFSLGIFVEYQKRLIDEQRCSCLVGRLSFPGGRNMI